MTRGLRLPESVAACLFDLDGVLTRTAELHAAAWKEAFNGVLQDRTTSEGAALPPFDLHADYETYVDGKPRADDVRAFLASRGIELAEGSPADQPSADTVHGVGRRKNDLVQKLMAQRGVAAYDGSVRFLAAVREAGLGRAVVTSPLPANARPRARPSRGQCRGLTFDDQSFDVVVSAWVIETVASGEATRPRSGLSRSH